MSQLRRSSRSTAGWHPGRQPGPGAPRTRPRAVVPSEEERAEEAAPQPDGVVEPSTTLHAPAAGGTLPETGYAQALHAFGTQASRLSHLEECIQAATAACYPTLSMGRHRPATTPYARLPRDDSL